MRDLCWRHTDALIHNSARETSKAVDLGYHLQSCMAPLSGTMNPAPGSLSHEAKLQERDETEKEGTPTRDKGSLSGCTVKAKAFTLPFSVESLISDRGTSRTSYSSSQPGIVLPKPIAEDRLRLSPMALYADKGFDSDSVTNLSDSKKGEMEELAEKGQSSWFQTPSYTTPPRKLTQLWLFFILLIKKYIFFRSLKSPCPTRDRISTSSVCVWWIRACATRLCLPPAKMLARFGAPRLSVYLAIMNISNPSVPRDIVCTPNSC